MHNRPVNVLIRTKHNESISTKLIYGNINIGDKYKVSRDNLINFICLIIDEMNQKHNQSK